MTAYVVYLTTIFGTDEEQITKRSAKTYLKQPKLLKCAVNVDFTRSNKLAP